MSTKVFDKLLEKATNQLLFEVDWDSILSMCDYIRQGDVPGKHAITQIKKKLTNENTNVLNFTLHCLESFVKNCGSKIHQEIATRDMMDVMRNLAASKPDPVKAKVLELIQCWAHAFKKNPNYKVVEEYFNAMKNDGFQFATLKESEAMFEVEEAPMWKEDSECPHCFRCQTGFGTFNRKHHCRCCGEIFCGACSSKTSAIPKFGIEKEVRVCDNCYDKLKGITPSASGIPGSSSSSSGELADTDGLPAEYVNSALYKEAKLEATKKPEVKSEQEFEEELQLAMALSQSEAEYNAKSSASGSNLKNNLSNSTSSAWPKLGDLKSSSDREIMSNPSAPYAEPIKSILSRNLKKSLKKSDTNQSYNSNDYRVDVYNDNDGNAAAYDSQTNEQEEEEMKVNSEIDEFVEELKKILELFVNRMKSDSMRGRSITNDTAVQSLFLQLQHYHPRLLSYIKYEEDARAHYENLQDKLTQLKDAREALNALRLDHEEKKRKEAEERERARQMQIQQKLQYMRQQKQSYYQYQNQLNLQRLQEQEREIQMRLEQQRQLTLKREQMLSGQVQPTLDGQGNGNGMPPMENLSLNEYAGPSTQKPFVGPVDMNNAMPYQQQPMPNQQMLMSQQFPQQQYQQQPHNSQPDQQYNNSNNNQPIANGQTAYMNNGTNPSLSTSSYQPPMASLPHQNGYPKPDTNGAYMQPSSQQFSSLQHYQQTPQQPLPQQYQQWNPQQQQQYPQNNGYGPHLPQQQSEPNQQPQPMGPMVPPQQFNQSPLPQSHSQTQLPPMQQPQPQLQQQLPPQPIYNSNQNNLQSSSQPIVPEAQLISFD